MDNAEQIIKKCIMTTTKQIGNIGEAKTLCKFVEMMVPIYVSFGDNERSDFVVD